MTSLFSEVKESLTYMLYPSRCIGCGSSSHLPDHIYCLPCLVDLPDTRLFTMPDNDMEYRLAGRIDIVAAAALYYFYKSGRIQSAIHDLKYRRNRKVAEVFGREVGKRWLAASRLEIPDMIVPVPLHSKRQYKRGYNQSLVFAQAISRVTNIPVYQALQKVKHTETQTHKTRQDRIVSIASSIRVRSNPNLANKHIMLVDDVLTTGATIEVCAKAIRKYEPSVRFSIATMALAETL